MNLGGGLGDVLRGVDVDRVGRQVGDRGAVDEAFGVKGVGEGEGVVADCGELFDAAVVDRRRGEEGEATVAVLVVVPGEELAQEGESVGEAREAVGEVGAVLEVLELGLGEGVVVADAGR